MELELDVEELEESEEPDPDVLEDDSELVDAGELEVVEPRLSLR